MVKRIAISFFLLCPILLTAQEKPEIEMKLVDAVTTKKELIMGGKGSIANFEEARLANMAGKKATIDLDRVTVVEYWSRSSADNSLYWNRLRELEHKYADNPHVQFISINYDYALGGEHQRKKADEFLSQRTQPQKLLFDLDDGVGEIFGIPGTIGYMLFDHEGEYLYVGRGDDPTTEKLFDLMDIAIEEIQTAGTP